MFLNPWFQILNEFVQELEIDVRGRTQVAENSVRIFVDEIKSGGGYNYYVCPLTLFHRRIGGPYLLLLDSCHEHQAPALGQTRMEV